MTVLIEKDDLRCYNQKVSGQSSLQNDKWYNEQQISAVLAFSSGNP